MSDCLLEGVMIKKAAVLVAFLMLASMNYVEVKNDTCNLWKLPYVSINFLYKSLCPLITSSKFVFRYSAALRLSIIRPRKISK